MSSEAPPKSSLLKWIVPIVLFVVIVGVLAWLTQNLPKGGDTKKKGPNPTPPVNSQVREPDLRFLYKPVDRKPGRPDAGVGVWDDDPFYAKESEQGQDGHYDFPFHNPHDYPVTIGFARASCDCSHLMVTVLDSA